jgi:hypothetical protein
MLAARGAVPLVAGERFVELVLRLVPALFALLELLAVVERFVVREPPAPPELFFAREPDPPLPDDLEFPPGFRCSAIPYLKIAM